LELSSEDGHLCDNNDSDEFWRASRERFLHVIVTPYRDGVHYVKQPTSFIPIICQLEELHEKGFVHGDIRGFNTVFDEDNKQGYLIDFDFGGKSERPYPKGYHTTLDDGRRRVDNQTHDLQDIILPWHDWYALGRLIFEVHRFELRQEAGMSGDDKITRMQLQDQRSTLSDKWDSLDNYPTTEMKNELKEFLEKAQEFGCEVRPCAQYEVQLKKISGLGTQRNMATKPCATGSPPQKKNL
jgi:serine/threonine protein kinase